ncbi:MAG: hypothetical protein KDK40_00225, partial [Chlamydiia bacterium]|nr:hypothetical protein [Chlamydiia bacterium]
ECINDNEIELEKWLIYYQERFRVRIIEWLRTYQIYFVFEEDLDFTKTMMEKLKLNYFQAKLPKDLEPLRKTLEQKAKIYYSNEALNPRPKRGRPPKQASKPETDVQISSDIYITVPQSLKPFLFTPEATVTSGTFSARFDSEELWSARAAERSSSQGEEISIESFQKKLSELRSLSSGSEPNTKKKKSKSE